MLLARLIVLAAGATPRGAVHIRLSDVAPPSIAECLEASFVPAVMGAARGDVTELKLFIAAAQAAHHAGDSVDGLQAAMGQLPVQSAGRPLASEELALRSQWIALVFLTLDHLAEASDSGLVSATVRDEYSAMVAQLVRAKREVMPLSKIDLDELSAPQASRTPSETALLRYAIRVVDVTLDNVEAEKAAGTRADGKQSARPFIPGSGSGR